MIPELDYLTHRPFPGRNRDGHFYLRFMLVQFES